MYKEGLHRVPYSRVVPCLGVRVLLLRNLLVNTLLLTVVYFPSLLYLTQRDDEHNKNGYMFIHSKILSETSSSFNSDQVMHKLRDCRETSVTKCESRMRNIPGERRSH